MDIPNILDPNWISVSKKLVCGSVMRRRVPVPYREKIMAAQWLWLHFHDHFVVFLPCVQDMMWFLIPRGAASTARLKKTTTMNCRDMLAVNQFLDDLRFVLIEAVLSLIKSHSLNCFCSRDKPNYHQRYAPSPPFDDCRDATWLQSWKPS